VFSNQTDDERIKLIWHKILLAGSRRKVHKDLYLEECNILQAKVLDKWQAHLNLLHRHRPEAVLR